MVSEVAPIALIEAMHRRKREFLSGADGCIARVSVQKDGAVWADSWFWQTMEHASGAMPAVAASEDCRAHFACMAAADHDDPGQGVTLFRTLTSQGPIGRCVFDVPDRHGAPTACFAVFSTFARGG